MNDIIESLTGITDYIQRAPAALLIVLGLNALGFALKYSPLPNRSIPLAVIVSGVLLTMFLCPLPEGRNPLLKLGVMGLLFACIAWGAHAAILRRIEKFLPGLGAEDEDKQPTTKP